MIIVKIEDKQNKDIKLYKEITNTWLLQFSFKMYKKNQQPK